MNILLNVSESVHRHGSKTTDKGEFYMLLLLTVESCVLFGQLLSTNFSGEDVL